jgi:hypothetical protein
MKFFHLFFINPSFIKNVDKPICKDCKYFRYDSIYNDYNYGQCTKFGKKNLINGKITFEDVVFARTNDCGVDGTYYEETEIKK